MYKEITLNLSDTVLERAAGIAAIVSRSVEDILAETLELTLPDLKTQALPPISSLSDKEVLVLANSRMEEKQDSLFSELLYKQQANQLSGNEQKELNSLFQIYLRMWLRQSEALAEAVNRGIHSPLSS